MVSLSCCRSSVCCITYSVRQEHCYLHHSIVEVLHQDRVERSKVSPNIVICVQQCKLRIGWYTFAGKA